MNVLIFFSVLLAVNAVSYEEHWKTFKINYGKTYKSAREESIRFRIFQNNLDRIEAHNTKYDRGQELWAMGINQFTDLTDEEVHYLYSLRKFDFPKNADIFEARKDVNVPEAIDWREKGAVLEVMDQGKCGSCYAFSAIASLEGQRAIKHNIREQLSEQEVVDCAESYGTNGCGGGWMNKVFDYIRDHGISLSSIYKYKASRETCVNYATARTNVTVTGTKFISNNTEAFVQAVGNNGPVSITIDYFSFYRYSHGIFYNPHCNRDPTHAMVIVGYASENGTDYWIVRNSWGNSWGENGYIRIKQSEKGVCGMYDHGMFPIIE